MSTKVHRVKDREVIRHFKKIPYDEMVQALKEDGSAFLEELEQPLKRQTVWKAARRLSQMVGKKVTCEKGLLQLKNSNDEETDVMEGYLFKIEE